MKAEQTLFIAAFSLLSGFLGQSLSFYFTITIPYAFVIGFIFLIVTFISGILICNALSTQQETGEK